MNKMIGLLIYLISLLLSSQIHAARMNVNNIQFQFAADHMWLFYECGGLPYFNHEVRNLRNESERSLTFHWISHATMLGMRYCDGFGFSFGKEKIVTQSKIQTVNTGNTLFYYYKPATSTTSIKYRSFKGRPQSTPMKTRWSRSSYLKDDLGRKISANQYSVTEYGGKIFTAFEKNNNAYLRNSDGKVFKLNINAKILSHNTFSMVTSVNKLGAKLVLLTAGQTLQGEKLHHITQIDLNDLSKGKISLQTDVKDLFYKVNEIQNTSLKTELSGKVAILFTKSNKRHKTYLDLENFNPGKILHNNKFPLPFSNKESLGYDMVQMPISCKMNSGCDLINFNYPLSSNWLQGISKLFHLSHGGKVVVEPISTIAVKFEEMELVGIIEGPPPVPLENILASFAALPQAFVLNAARGLSKMIKTNLNQVMTMVNTQSKEEAQTKVHSVSMNGTIPLLVPIKLSGMATFKSKVVENVTTKKTTIVKKTYSNEIQHASDAENKLFMKPVGKLIFLKYDITGLQYKFLDSNNNPIEHGPSLYSLAKTNIRPVVRQYDMIARQVLPHKYQNSFTVGDIHTYHNFHRRRQLLDKASELAPGHNYLSFTYNNALDLSTEIDIKTSSTNTRTVTDSFKTEGSVGAGYGEIFGAEVKMSNEEERTTSVANTAEKGMGINVLMNFVVPTEDASVKFYDFEVYYLEPSKENYTELIDQLNDTATKSIWNRKMLKTIKKGSLPWKVTYSVSNILENQNLPIDDKDDIYGEGHNLNNANEKSGLPVTYFGLSERCLDVEFLSTYEKACLKAQEYMQNNK
ncbi:MAG: hypothetical protein HN576_00370 [Bacteriovoracaceae bacterium]|nr:hypothetical protein [Bacteriovoracaceae bacterium]